MTDAEFRILVAKMRLWQRRFRVNGSRSALIAAEDYARRVDHELRRQANPGLFDQMRGEVTSGDEKTADSATARFDQAGAASGSAEEEEYSDE